MCDCKLCQRDNGFKAEWDKLLESQKPYWLGIYNELTHAEMDRDVNAAIIDGSWPSADEQIEIARNRPAQPDRAATGNGGRGD